MNNIEDKLKQLKIEDMIWFIYLGIIILSWYSNNLERNYFLYKDFLSKKKYKKIMIIIFSILVLVYLYFLLSSYSDIKKIDFNKISRKDLLYILSFIGSLLVFVSGIIFLYIVYHDDDLEVEVAFN